MIFINGETLQVTRVELEEMPRAEVIDRIVEELQIDPAYWESLNKLFETEERHDWVKEGF